MGGGGGGSSYQPVQQTPDQIVEQTNNSKLWNYYVQSYKPFIEKYITHETANAGSDAQAKQVAGQVNAETMKGFGSVNPRNLSAVGIAKQATNAAYIETGASEDAQAKVRQRQLGSLQNIVDIGRGQQTNVQQGQEAIAGQSLRSAISSKESDVKMEDLRQQETGMIQNSIGSALGAGAAIAGRSMKTPTMVDDDPANTPGGWSAGY